MKFHLNYKGEAGKCNASVGACPFGGAEDHFATEDEARQAYEKAHAAFSAPVKKTPSSIIQALNLDKASDSMLADLKNELRSKPWSDLTDDEHVAIAAITSVQEQRARGAQKKPLDPKQVLEYERLSDLTNGKVSPSELAEADGYDGTGIDERIAGFKQDRIEAAQQARARADANPNSMGDEIEAQELERQAGLTKPRRAAKKTTTKRPVKKTITWAEDKVPSVTESKIIVAPAVDLNEKGTRQWRGGKVPDSYLPQREAAKNVRADIREAVKAGELPKDLSYSVRMETGAWVTTISIVLGEQAENGRPQAIPREDQQDHRIQAVVKYLDALGNQYSTTYSDPFDNYNSHNRARVSFMY